MCLDSFRLRGHHKTEVILLSIAEGLQSLPVCLILFLTLLLIVGLYLCEELLFGKPLSSNTLLAPLLRREVNRVNVRAVLLLDLQDSVGLRVVARPVQVPKIPALILRVNCILVF